jgi:hypothetical protein
MGPVLSAVAKRLLGAVTFSRARTRTPTPKKKTEKTEKKNEEEDEARNEREIDRRMENAIAHISAWLQGSAGHHWTQALLLPPHGADPR